MSRRGRTGAPRPAAAAVLVAAALVVALYGTAIAFRQGDGHGRGAASSIPLVPPAAAAEPAPPPSEPLPVFAASDGVALRLPSPGVVAVAFHEASYRDAVALRPAGACIVCRNRRKFRPPPPRREGLSYIVTDTRGRATAATSAVDVVLPERTPVLSPVTGTVTGVKRYRLYTRYPDVRVEIRPDAAPDRRVVLLHLSNVRTAIGDRVEASSTPVGVVRGFGFESQVDRYVRGRNPHVHIEVKDPDRRRRAKKKR